VSGSRGSQPSAFSGQPADRIVLNADYRMGQKPPVSGVVATHKHSVFNRRSSAALLSK
jgi:hypothetical protein